jgi:NAD(P)-dependent dehydrogenase (short-subunit alcohol dehydrogenase family)
MNRPQPSTWKDEQVVLLTGGARGITAEIAKAFARRGACKLAILARHQPAAQPLDEQQARTAIIQKLRSEGKTIQPKMVEKTLMYLRKTDEARKNLLELQSNGAEIMFLQTDVTQPKSIQQSVQKVLAKWGKIDIAIHGAGTEVSRLLKYKTEQEFMSVYSPKALGGSILINALPENTFFVSMGSIAGRFGNPDRPYASPPMFRSARRHGSEQHHRRGNRIRLPW